MRYSFVWALGTVTTAGLLALAGCSQPAESGNAAAGAPLELYDVPTEGMTLQFVRDPVQVEDLVMQDLGGDMLSMTDLRGKVTLVNYWATWCGPMPGGDS